MLQHELEKRKVPNVLQMNDGTIVKNMKQWKTRKEEIAHILWGNLYGYAPDFSLKVEGVIVKTEENDFGGKAITYDMDIRIKSPFSYFSFPYKLTIPKEITKPPVFLSYSFSPNIADGIGEEIIDNGYAVANVYYQDIVPDKDDGFYSGLGRFCTRNKFDSWGKIAMWAWGGSRIMDYLETCKAIDINKTAIIGHSRLGKTALLCGAMDERFSLVVSNDSGAGGAALFRGKTGERIKDLSGKGSSFWFCGNFLKYIGKEDKLPFDQHYLLSLIAPRNLYICSASEDEWADPYSEFLACIAVNPAYDLYQEKGIITNDGKPEVHDYFHDGKIGYHLRKGTHYLSRYDWNKVMEYRKRHRV